MLALGIDPATKHTGIAVVEDVNGVPLVRQVWCARAKGRLAIDRFARMAAAIRDVCSILESSWDIGVSVVERQKIYKGSAEKNPNSIMDCNLMSGAAVLACLECFDGDLLMPTPPEWKGSIKKAMMTARIRRKARIYDSGHLRNIASDEACGLIAGWHHLPKPAQIDAIDAIGLAMWGLEKARGRNYPVR